MNCIRSLTAALLALGLRRWRQLCERCSDPACEHASLLSR